MMNASSENPLYLAVVNGDIDAVREHWKQASELRQSPLAHAADLGIASVVAVCLELGCTDAVPAPPAWPALHLAVFKGHADCLAILLGPRGGPAKATDPIDGLTPLHLAALKGHVQCTTMLIEHLAAPDLDAKDRVGRTPLICAAIAGSAAVIRLLAEQGAPLDATSNDGRTALHWAIVSHRPAAVEALVQLGCPAGADAEGQTALDHARARQGKDPVLRHIAEFLQSGQTQMAELPWIAHAKALPAAADESPVEGAAAATGADETDIFAVEEVEGAVEEEAPALEAAAPAAEGKGAPEAAAAADLDELD